MSELILFPGAKKAVDRSGDRLLVSNFLSPMEFLPDGGGVLVMRFLPPEAALELGDTKSGVDLMYRPDSGILGLMTMQHAQYSGGSPTPDVIQSIQTDHWEQVCDDIRVTTGLQPDPLTEARQLSVGDEMLYIEYTIIPGAAGVPKILKVCWLIEIGELPEPKSAE